MTSSSSTSSDRGMQGSAGMTDAGGTATATPAAPTCEPIPSRIAPEEVARHVRAITDAEEAFYHAHGWVKMPRLISPALAEELRVVGAEWHRRMDKPIGAWHGIAFQPGGALFRAVVFDPTMGRNAQRLFGRRRLSGTDVGVRYRIDHYVCKGPGTNGASYHQDTTEHGTDRSGEVQFWIALAQATPEMGTMRFLPDVHREGPLGSAFGDAKHDLLQMFPRLTELYPPTDPIAYEPGDATVHHSFMVHGSGTNTTDRDRVSYILSYTPEDALWWNGAVGNWGSQRKVLSDERNPVVFRS